MNRRTPSTPAGRAVAINEWVRTAQVPLLRGILEMAQTDDVISFALGLPAPECLPTEAYARACATVLAEDPEALQLGPPFEPLKRHIAGLMKCRGVECTPEEIVITTGAQQALDLVARLLVPVGSQVAVEETTFHGVLQAVSPYGTEVLAIRSDCENGIDTNDLEALLKRGVRPAFLYVIPDGHNPTGACMVGESRRRLVRLAHEYGMPIVEDDAYGLLSYGSLAEAPLRSLDREMVFSIGSFSKILAPALRLGWIVIPVRFRSAFSILRDLAEVDAVSFTQRAVSALFDSGAFPNHLAGLRNTYQRRRDALLRTLQESLAGRARWCVPKAGFFIWLRLPEMVDTEQLFGTAVTSAKVAYAPGSAFCTTRQARAKHCLRLSFSHAPVDRFDDGIRRLARVIEKQGG